MTSPHVTDAEWAASLTAEETLKLVRLALEQHDMPTAASAIRLLAVKDPGAAQLVLDALDLARTS